MFILRLLRFLAGSVEFSAFGVFPERFLNLCTQNHIPLWMVRCGQNRVTACTLARRYKKMRALAKKSGVRLKSGRRRGLPFILHRYRKRVGLLAGIVLFIGILYTLSLFVWTVEITGNTSVDEQTIRDTLSSLGLRPGVLSSSVSPDELKRDALLELPELSWLTINLKGSSVIVEVRERVVPPIVVPEDRPCNIVADIPGQIVTLEVYAGKAEVQKGDAVTQGQLLVSGTI
ncbi:MAG: sporulation protein YqfD, partial [Clostridiales bacterium]|nr:sporulation protein YqfD [Clostridiales bacterium]